MKKFLLSLFFVIIGFNLWLALSHNLAFYRVLKGTIFSGKMNPDIDELNDFATNKIEVFKPQPWAKSVNYNTVLPNKDLLTEAINYQTTGLLVIKNDSILYEEYWENKDEKSVSNSFSMAKSFTSILIGVALKDGLIKSLDEPVGNYIESYNTEPFNKITIKHLLTMSSGLYFNESYGSPFSWPAIAYYGTDVNATVLTPELKTEPGKIFQYKGGDTQLLGIILKKVTGKSVTEYAYEKLWSKIGSENTAYWSLDKENGMEKVSCCYYATARDFARFGKLYSNFGNWNGVQIVDTSFVIESLTPINIPNHNNKNVDFYGYQWWLLNYKNMDVFYARGIRGQYIFSIPSKNLIIVRLGHKRAEKKDDDLPNDIFVYLDLGLEISK